MPQPTNDTVRKKHKVGIVKALTIQFRATAHQKSQDISSTRTLLGLRFVIVVFPDHVHLLFLK